MHTATPWKQYYTHWQVTCEHADRDDDDMRTGLRGHLAALMPQEVIMPKGRLSSTTSKVLKASLRQPRLHQLPAGIRAEAYMAVAAVVHEEIAAATIPDGPSVA